MSGLLTPILSGVQRLAALFDDVGAVQDSIDALPDSPIKSIQRGTVSLTSSVNNITISAVALDKSFVTAHTSTPTALTQVPRVRLTSTTNLEADPGTSGGSLAWEVVEFN